MTAEREAPFVPRGPFRALVFRALLEAAHGLYKAGNGCLFAAAGVLRYEELQAASVDQDRRFNLSSLEVDAGLSPAEQHFYGRFLRAGDRVLLVGCGTGRDLIGLHLLGYEVTGLEPSPGIVTIAMEHVARRGLSVPIVTGLIQSADLGGPHDAVIFSNGCYSLVQGSSVRIAALGRVAQRLTPRGRVILSYHPATSQSTLGGALLRAAARLAGADWTPERGDLFSRAGRVDGVRYLHAFAPGDIARECDAAGLAVLADEHYPEGYRFAAAERRC